MGYPPEELAKGYGAYEASREDVVQPALPYGFYSASTPVLTGRGYLVYVTVRETSGSAAAVVRVWDAPAASGRGVANFSLAANGSSQFTPGDMGVLCVMGLYVEVVSGAAEVALGFRYSE